MNLSIIGTGHVGLVTGACFAEKGHRVLCVDNNAEKIARLRDGKIPIYEPGLDDLVRVHAASGRLRFESSIAKAVEEGEVIFVSVGTPPLPDGSPDLSYIEAVAREIARHLTAYRIVVEKSTVPVRTGERVHQTLTRYAPAGAEFDVASNPEFLAEGSAVRDCLQPDRIVLGVSSRRAAGVLRSLYAEFGAPIIVTDINSAELIKHASNSFLALKISYINAVAAICEKTGADVTEVARGMGMDRRIGPQFLKAGLGYGGSCFPKDVDAFVSLAESVGVAVPLFQQIQAINRQQRDRFFEKIEQELWVLKDKTVALWGLAFKPNTDDLREAPALTLIEKLLAKGAKVAAYDPKAMPETAALFPAVRMAKDPVDAATGADCIALCTEWEEFAAVDFDAVKRVMTHPVLVDGRNLYDPKVLRAKGFVVRGMGRA